MSRASHNAKQLQVYLEGIERLRPFLGSELDDGHFAEIIHMALGEWRIAEDDFRDAFALSESTVLRWSAGQNLPQPMIRPIIVEWICDRLVEEAKKLGESAH